MKASLLTSKRSAPGISRLPDHRSASSPLSDLSHCRTHRSWPGEAAGRGRHGCRGLIPESVAAWLGRATTGLLVTLAAGLTATMPVLAQTQDDPPITTSAALVSNMSQPVTGTISPRSGYDVAQAFTTGANPDGYTLESIELNIRNLPDASSDLVVSVHATAGSSNVRLPGTSLHTLTNPPVLSVGANAFAAPSDATLAADTTYVVRVRYSGGLDDFKVGQISSDAVDSGGAAGWSITSGALFILVAFDEWEIVDTVSIRVNGAAVGVKTAPAFTSPAKFSVNENQVDVGTVKATAGEDEVVYAIAGGADASHFEIGTRTGVLTFRTAPNHESPTDVDSMDPTNDGGNNEYIVTVAATRGTGVQARTAEQTLTVTVVDVPELPNAPEAPAVAPGTDSTRLRVTWSAPENAGRPRIDSYDLRYRTPADTSFIDGPQDVYDTHATIVNLEAGTDYEIQVRAANRDGHSAWSAPGTGTTHGADLARPGLPGELTASVRDEEVELSWAAPSSGGAGPILYYQYRVNANDGGRGGWHPNWSAGERIDATATGRTFGGLCNGATHVYELRAVNAAGPGPAARVEAIPRGLVMPAVSITALTPTVEHGLDPNKNGRHDDDNNIASFMLSRSGDVSERLCGINLDLVESSDHATTLFASGQRTRTLKHIAIDLDQAGQPECSITFAVEPGDHYTVAGSDRATVDVRGPGEICMAAPVPRAADAQVVPTPDDEPRLTASLQSVPAAHGGPGSEPFTIRVLFSETVKVSYKVLRDESFTVTGGQVVDARRVDGRDDLREIHVEPSGLGDVTVMLAGGRACATTGAICTADGRMLSHSLATIVQGPVTLSVADARANENNDDTLAFLVTLSQAAAEAVTVDYATADGTATAGTDYTGTNGTLTFAVGETEKTVSVAILNDAHDDGAETLTLTLSNAIGAQLLDAEATGTIENTDPLLKAWTARFGRTAAQHVVDGVGARVAASRAAGMRATLAGRAVSSVDSGTNDTAGSAGTRAGAAASASAVRDFAALADRMAGDDAASPIESRALSGRELLTGSAFALTGGADGGGSAAFWGRGARSRFDGRDGDLSLEGEVTTAMLGADYAAERWITGLALSQSVGDGAYRTEGDSGRIESTLTGLYPYAGYDLDERLSVWAVAGYGEGTLTLVRPEETRRTAIAMVMAAAGVRGDLVSRAGAEGLALTLESDGLIARTTSDAVPGLVVAEADVTRLRLGLDAGYGLALHGGVLLTPSVEIGLRHDGGDAETGFGVEIGGGLALAAPARGISMSLAGRGLLAHEADGDVDERGASVSLEWDSTPSSDRGPSLSLRHSVGASSSGGADALLGRETLAGLAANDNATPGGQLEAEFGYGFGVLGGRFTGTPHAGFGLTETGHDIRLGWRLSPARTDKLDLAFGIEATRTAGANDDGPQYGIAFRATMRW